MSQSDAIPFRDQVRDEIRNRVPEAEAVRAVTVGAVMDAYEREFIHLTTRAAASCGLPN